MTKKQFTMALSIATSFVMLCSVFPPRAAALSSTTTARTRTPTRLEWQEKLLQSAEVLEATPLSDALSTLRRDGVVRIDGRSASVDPVLCANLKRKILEEVANGDRRWGEVATKSSSEDDKSYVPGTRLRFLEPIDVAFGNSRHDLLLPLSNPDRWPEVQPVLRSAIRQLQPFLVAAVNELLPRLYGSSSSSSSIEKDNDLELVELAGLMSRPGSQHQCVHGDYRRFHDHAPPLPPPNTGRQQQQAVVARREESFANTQNRMGKLPPRLVTFVALQDIPTTEHGSTVFVTGTHTAHAHEWVYEGQGVESCRSSSGDDEYDASDIQKNNKAVKARESVLKLSSKGVVTASRFRCGDMLVYDASVLHWGGPNNVPNNDRAILYFGVARPGAAAILSGEEKEMLMDMGFTIAPPVLVRDVAAAAGFA